ncbi:MAG: hypothetical protein P1S60_09505 [Anaerolineae bacterium]|nr:hypothetical protein [Anaerolineae bacterium]
MQRPNQFQIVADFFSQGYRVSGMFMSSNRTLSDVVHDITTNFIRLQDAYISAITDPATISAYYHSTLLNKACLDFILTIEQKDGLRRDQLFSMGNQFTYQVFLTIPFFQLMGTIHSLTRSFNPRSYIGSDVGPFITLTDVTATCTFQPAVQFQGGAALVSRDKIGFFGEKVSEA